MNIIESLLESDDGDKERMFQDFVDQGDPPPDRGDFEVAYAMLHRLIARPATKIYRAMQLTEKNIEALTTGCNLGEHWSKAWIPENVRGFSLRQGDGTPRNWYLFTAQAATKDIDVEMSIWYNTLFPDEEQIAIITE